MMTSTETVTLTWSKQELEMMLQCVSRYFPRPPLMISAASRTYCCPTCCTLLKETSEYCSCCGQQFDWDTAYSLIDPTA